MGEFVLGLVVGAAIGAVFWGCWWSMRPVLTVMVTEDKQGGKFRWFARTYDGEAVCRSLRPSDTRLGAAMDARKALWAYRCIVETEGETAGLGPGCAGNA